MQKIPLHAPPSQAADSGGPRTKSQVLEFSYWGFLLIAIGRVAQLIPIFASLPIGKLCVAFAVIALIANWTQLPPVATQGKPIVRCAVALAAIAILTLPLSIWPGASFGFLHNNLPVLFGTVLLGIKAPKDWKTLRGTFLVLTICGAVLACSATLHFHGGRADVDSTMYDPNDLAYVLASIFPIGVGFALTASQRRVKVIYSSLAGLIALSLLLTASRGGLLGLSAIVICLVLLPIGRPRAQAHDKKTLRSTLTALVVLLALLCAVWSQLPAETRTRLATIVAPSKDYNFNEDESHSRMSIWSRNLPAALHNPIGFGVNTFEMVDLRTGGQFMAAHNSYLQILTELGVLGLFFFVRTYWLCWLTLQRARQRLIAGAATPEANDAVVFLRMLQISLAGNAVCAFFLSMAYANELWTLAALTVASISIVDRFAQGSAAALPRRKTRHKPHRAAAPGRLH